MDISVFNFKDYKTYLGIRIRSRPKQGHGERSRIAKAVRCHSGYISQILEGSAHLSLEQAALLNFYFGHNDDEARFFIFLVELARAGNDQLRNQFKSLIQEMLDKRSLLSNRQEYKQALPETQQAIYYSAWYYAAIHLLLTIPEFRTKKAIETKLDLPSSKIAEVLEFFVTTGIARKNGDHFDPGDVNLYLADRSPFSARHHTQWRLKAIESIDRSLPSDLHFSSVHSISRADLPQVREILLKAIEDIRGLVKPSPEEEIFCYNIDLFQPR